MTGNKSAHFFALLCVLFTSSVLISDVNARSVSGHGHGHSGSHHTSHSSIHHASGHSVGDHRSTRVKHSQPHAYPSAGYKRESVSAAHGYPSFSSHSLSGNSGSSSAHSYPVSSKLSGAGSKPESAYHSKNYGTISAPAVQGYPASRPNSLSGGGSGSLGHGYPSSNIQSNFGTQFGSYQNPLASHVATSGSTVHSYPTSHSSSLSGSGSSSSGHGYPSSNILSNFGTQLGSVQIPSTIHMATNGLTVHSYPTSRPNSLSGGGSGSTGHNYPPSNTLSGSGSQTGSVTFTTGGSSYPQNTYHSSNTHHSTSWGSNTQVHHANSPIVHHTHHYVYNPPTVIHYGSPGTNPISYPVYTGAPPPYVYEYRSSGNKYSHLLAGLALYNLGRMSENHNSHHYHSTYVPRPDESCKFGVQYRTGNFEEMAIDCRTITYFIYENEPHPQTHVTTNLFNQTTMTTQLMFSNGTLMEPQHMQNQNNAFNRPGNPNMPQILSQNDTLLLQQMLGSNGQLLSNFQPISSMTTTQVTSVNDPRFIGRPVEIKPDMECYITRNTRYSNTRKSVPCELLQKYSASLRNAGAVVKSSLIVILVSFVLILY